MHLCFLKPTVQSLNFSSDCFSTNVFYHSLQFQGKIWEHGIPVSFQQFKNYYFGQPGVLGHDIVNYSLEDSVCKKDKKEQAEKGCFCNQWDLMANDMNSQKEKALHTIFPEHGKGLRCTMLLLSNLAESDWITVDCSDRMLGSVFCSLPSRNYIEPNSHQRYENNTICLLNSIFYNNTCFFFLLFQSKVNGSISQFCGKFKTTALSEFSFKDWKFLFDAIQPPFPPVLLEENSSYLEQILVRKYLYMFEYKFDKVLSFDAEGFVVCHSLANKSQSYLPKHLLEKGAFVPQSHQCDGIVDCSLDGSDEEHCLCESSVKNHLCRELKQHSGKVCCGPLYHRSKEGTCEKYWSNTRVETVSEWDKNSVLFECSTGFQINSHFLNDLVPQCGGAEDEPELIALLTNNVFVFCDNLSQLHCLEGHSRCFDIFDICIFHLDFDSQLFPCKTGAHIENCEEFLCNKKFKCAGSYCIPWQFVCDGKWDCSTGNDERFHHICNKEQCVGMFLCHKSKFLCVPVSNVCDGYVECPSGDDETLCDLSSIDCPDGCHCLTYALQCENVSFDFQYMTKLPFQYLAFHDGFVNDFNGLNDVFGDAVHLLFQNSHISDVCAIFTLEKMIHVAEVDFRINRIFSLQTFCFHSHQKVVNILLPDNSIQNVKAYSFAHLFSLVFVDLSRNPVCHLAPYFLVNATNFKIFMLLGCHIHHLNAATFQVLNVKLVITKDFKICCVTHPSTKCEADPPWFLSCSDLLPGRYLKVLFGAISALVVLSNTLSLVTHVVTRKRNGTFSSLAVSVNMTDLLCAVYLCVIWISDQNLKGFFVLQETVWRSSVPCHFAFATIVVYTVNVQLVMLLLALSRMMIVVNPINTYFRCNDFVVKILCLFFLFSSMMGIFLTYRVSIF